MRIHNSTSDPWWVFTTCYLFYVIKRQYNLNFIELVTISPRFGIMLVSMCLSILFVVLDACSVLGAFSLNLPKGVQPFWKVDLPDAAPTQQEILTQTVIVHFQMPLRHYHSR